MAFKVNDLLINVAPDDPERPQPQCQILMVSGGCKTSPLLTLTPVLICLFLANSRPIPFSIDCADPLTAGKGETREISPELLAALKDQLKLALDEIDRQTMSVEDVSNLQNVAEIEDLQARLHKAIDTLNRRKEQLRRK